MEKIAILNTSILTEDGLFKMESISLEDAKKLIEGKNIDSAVGHQSTADILTTLLGTQVPMNRQLFKQEVGQIALVFKLNGRPEEGKILTKEDIKKIGFSFKKLTRLE